MDWISWMALPAVSLMVASQKRRVSTEAPGFERSITMQTTRLPLDSEKPLMGACKRLERVRPPPKKMIKSALPNS